MKITDIQEIVTKAREKQGCYVSMAIEINDREYSDGGLAFSVWHADEGKHSYFPTLLSAIQHLKILAGMPEGNGEEIE